MERVRSMRIFLLGHKFAAQVCGGDSEVKAAAAVLTTQNHWVKATMPSDAQTSSTKHTRTATSRTRSEI